MLHNAIGLTPKVVAFYDANENSKVDMYIGVDRPDFGITTYSTIGLSEHSIGFTNSNDEDIRVEFISICNSSVFDFANVIATCAFNIINDNYSCQPGTVYPDMIESNDAITRKYGAIAGKKLFKKQPEIIYADVREFSQVIIEAKLELDRFKSKAY